MGDGASMNARDVADALEAEFDGRQSALLAAHEDFLLMLELLLFGLSDYARSIPDEYCAARRLRQQADRAWWAAAGPALVERAS